MGWESAERVAIDEAKKTTHSVHAVKIQDIIANTRPNPVRITRHKARVKLSIE